MLNTKIQTVPKQTLEDSLGRRVFTVANYAILTLIALISLIPIVNVLSMSFSSNAAVSSGAVTLWPVDFTVGAYQRIIENGQFFHSFLISVERSVLGILHQHIPDRAGNLSIVQKPPGFPRP